MFSFNKKKRWSYDLTSVDEAEKEGGGEVPQTKEAHEQRRSLNIRASFKYFGLNEKKKDKNRDKSKANDTTQQTEKDSKTTDGTDEKDSDKNSETEFLKCDKSTESPSKETSESPSELKKIEAEEENFLDQSQNGATELRNESNEAKLKKRPSFLEEVLAETESLNLSSKQEDENKN